MGNSDNDVSDRYLMIINGPLRIENKGSTRNSRNYDTNEFGGGNVSVYEVLGKVPGTRGDLGHIVQIGSFRLQPKEGKTLQEYMEEVREGIKNLPTFSQ